jgi:hypothetical protein
MLCPGKGVVPGTRRVNGSQSLSVPRLAVLVGKTVMPAQKQFGRRGVPQIASRPSSKLADMPAPVDIPVPVEVARDEIAPHSPSLDSEPYDWNEPSRQYVKPAKAPWRTFVVIASVGFGATSWLLPQDVANVTEIVFGVMGAASLYVGYRSWRQAAIQ